MHVARSHIAPRLALTVIDRHTLTECLQRLVEAFIAHVATAEGEPGGGVVVADRRRVLEALGSLGKVLLVEVVPPEGAHRPRTSPLAQLPSLPVKFRLLVDVPQHAEHSRVFLLLLHEPREHLQGLLLVVLLNEDVDALLLEPCLREQLNGRQAEPQLHVPVRQDQDIPQVRLIGRGVERLR